MKNSSNTLFSEIRYTLGQLIEQISIGDVGLPDIQRPFVWKNARVRDLFDSMYRGYPVGHLLLWQNAFDDGARPIGVSGKQKAPRLLVVDGQQRLTSVYAVFKGLPVLRENFEEEHIEIAFNPISQRFEVADAAIRRDRSFIPNISALFGEHADIFDIVDGYLTRLREAGDLDSETETRIKNAIKRLNSLPSFPLSVLELSSTVDEEQVAEVFVRINSQGKSLNQSDFILTLMSVFWEEGRKELEDFCRNSRVPSTGEPTPFNHFLKPEPDQLLRVAVGLAFRRARLKYVYSMLRGKDLETGAFSTERRDTQFEALRVAQDHVLNLTNWHGFLDTILRAGFRGGRFISSTNNIVYCYVLYLIGLVDFGVDRSRLSDVIAEWFFMSSLTGRYTGSPESAMEFDLARFREATTADEFVSILKNVCASTLTPDYWEISLPVELATSASRSPSLFGYYAALVLLDARALFSNQKVADLLDPSVRSKRSRSERHHLFPKAYLKTLGIKSSRRTNQIANMAVLEWGDNAKVADKAPASYLPEMIEAIPKHEQTAMYNYHALPDGWESMAYDDFLERRRELIARVIRSGYEILSNRVRGVELTERELNIDELVAEGESSSVEFKSTLRTNLHTGKPDTKIENSALKTIAGFLNGKGGTLIIGVADNGDVVGLKDDGFRNDDKMYLHFINIVKARLGTTHMMYIHPRFEALDGHRVFTVQCEPARSPVFLVDGNQERFYLRTGAATSELSGSQTSEYVRKRF